MQWTASTEVWDFTCCPSRALSLWWFLTTEDWASCKLWGVWHAWQSQENCLRPGAQVTGSNHQTDLSHKSRGDIHDRYTAFKCSCLDHNLLFWFFRRSFYLCLVQSVTASAVADHFNGKTGNIIQTSHALHPLTIPSCISIVLFLFSYWLTGKIKTWRKYPNSKGLNIELESALKHQLRIWPQRLTTCSQYTA